MFPSDTTMDLDQSTSASNKPPKLPIHGARNILVTSALPQVTKDPHVGNIIDILSADVFARYCRLRGYNTIYICGTDDHGMETENKANEEKITPKDISDKYHAIHRDVYNWFDISFDEFGRTSCPKQTDVCRTIMKKIEENNWLIDRTMQQPYCKICKCFLADWLVKNGTGHPKCKKCTKNAVIRDTDHLFLDFPLLKDKMEIFVKKMTISGSGSQITAVKELLETGLRPRCITSHRKWGVPVDDEKVFDVWFDSPVGYISITSCYTSNWEEWWKNPNVELYQFMKKDSVGFQTAMIPSTLLGSDGNCIPATTICATEYLKYEAGKFSKSKGIGVFGEDAKNTNIPSEAWRYYLLTIRPEVAETQFEWKDFQDKLNNKLFSKLGNFFYRVLSFISDSSGYDSVIPSAAYAESHSLTKELGDKVEKCVEQYVQAMEKVELKLGLENAMMISEEGNRYLQSFDLKTLYETDPASCAIVIQTSVGIVYLLASLLEPFLPSFSVEVVKQLKLASNVSPLLSYCKEIEWARKPWELVPSNHKIGVPKRLFQELKDTDMELFKNKFAGSEAGRKRKRSQKTKLASGKSQPVMERELKGVLIGDILEHLSSEVKIYKATYDGMDVLAFHYPSLDELMSAISCVNKGYVSNVLIYLGVCSWDGKWYGVFEDFSYTLKDFLENSNVSKKQACSITRDILRGLKGLFALGLHHGSLQTENIAIIEKGGLLTAKLMGLTRTGDNLKAGVEKDFQSLKSVLLACFGKDNPEIKHLVKNMDARVNHTLYFNYCKDMESLLDYPVFWDEMKGIMLLYKVADMMRKLDSIDEKSSLFQSISWTYSQIKAELNTIHLGSWDGKLTDAMFVASNRKTSYRYRRTQCFDLVKFIRNFGCHFGDNDESIQDAFGSHPVAYYHFFIDQFPQLLITTYDAVFSRLGCLVKYGIVLDNHFIDFFPIRQERCYASTASTC